MPIPTCSTCGKPFEPTRYRQYQCEVCFTPGRAGRSPSTQAQDAEYSRSRAELFTIFDRQPEAPCHWCPTLLTRDTATADHVVPVARGGSNAVTNLVLACSRCNGSKGAGDAPRGHTARSPAPRSRQPAPPGAAVPPRPGLV